MYSDNYPGAGGLSPCPLCLLHLDCQALAFQCTVIKNNVKITESYSKLFDTSVTSVMAKMLVKIDRVRDDFKNMKMLL